MPKKTSIKRAAKEFLSANKEIREYFDATAGLKEPYSIWTADHAIIRLYREFEQMILTVLTGTINQDTTTISNTTGIDFPKHISKGVCQYLIVGDGFFDFRGRSGLIEVVKRFVPDTHFLVTIISDKTYTQSLDRLSALRNFATHESAKSKKAAYAATGNKKLSSAGSWLRTESRFESICTNINDLVKEIERKAPF